VSFENAINLSIRVTPNSHENVKAFGLPGVVEKSFRAQGFVGAIEEGGHLNCRILSMAPHGMGTHTESIRHIVEDGPGVCDVAPLTPFRVRLITLSTVSLGATEETYLAGEPADQVITNSRLKVYLKGFDGKGLIIRTNGELNKTCVDYTSRNPTYFTSEAMANIARSIDHLLVDLPSVDRESDHGLLLNHRSFWKVEVGETRLKSDSRVERTISEMVYAPAHVKDGDYWCLIAVPNIDTDALPCRVLIWK